MRTGQDISQTIERYHLGLAEFVKGNPGPQKEMFSHREDVTLGNPFGGARRGRQQVVEELEHASSFYRDGEVIAFETVAEYVTPDLACIFEIERYKAKFGGSQDITPRSIRVTSIFRSEDGNWKLVHRHADPLVSAQPPESIARQ